MKNIERINWKRPVLDEDPPVGEYVLIIAEDGLQLYTEIAWMNDCHEWVDVPHYHRVKYWGKIPEELKAINK